MTNDTGMTEETQQPIPQGKGKKILINFGIAVGCVVFFVLAFVLATNFFTSGQNIPIQDGKAIIQKVEKSDQGCEFVVRLDGEDIILNDKDPETCTGLEEGMDITQQILSTT